MEENAKWLDSIEGKTYQFTNALETMWSNMISSDMVKSFVDFGTGMVQFLDTLPGKITAVLAALAGFAKFKGFSVLGLGQEAIQNIQNIQQSYSTLSNFKNKFTTKDLQTKNINAYAAAVSNLTAKQQANLLATSGLSKAQIQMAMQYNNLSNDVINEATAHIFATQSMKEAQEEENILFNLKAKNTAESLRAKAATEKNTNAKKLNAAASILESGATKKVMKDKLEEAVQRNKINDSLKEELVATLGLIDGNKGLWDTFKGIFAANPFGVIATAASIAIPIITTLIDKLHQSKEELQEISDNAINSYTDNKKQINSQKQTIDELAKSYSELSKGVDPLTNENLSLPTEEYQNYLDVCNKIADVCPEVVSGFDSQGNAILTLKGNVDQLTASYEAAAQANRQQLITSGDDVLKSFRTNVFDSDEIFMKQDGLNRQLEVAEKLQEAINSGDKDIMQKTYDALFENNWNALNEVVKAAGMEWGDFRNQITGEVDVESFKKQAPKILSFIKSTKNKINSETAKVKTLIEAYLGEDADYNKLNKETQALVNQVVSNFDAKFIDGFSDADSLWNWVKTNVVDTFSDINLEKEISSALSNTLDLQSKFKSDEIGLKEYKQGILDFVNDIKSSGLGEEVQNQLLQMFNINLEDSNSIGKEIDQMLKYAQSIVTEKAKDQVLELSYSDLQIINSEDFNVDDKVFSWNALQERIKEVRREMTSDFTMGSLSDYSEDMTKISESISTYQGALDKLSDGSFTIQDFVSLIEQYPDLAKGVDLASKNFDGLSDNLRRAIKNAPDKLTDELKNLRKQLKELGKDTTVLDGFIQELEELPTNGVEKQGNEFLTLADKINAAASAKARYDEAMSEDPQEGYKSRSDAFEAMKGMAERGEFGSESKIWDAYAYLAGEDNADVINRNAEALATFLDTWSEMYKMGDDGNLSYESVEKFLDYAEDKIGDLSLWSYDAETGALNIDFDNIDFEDLAARCEMAEGAFMDFLYAIALYHDVEFEGINDITNHMKEIRDGAGETADKLRQVSDVMNEAYGGGDVDLENRPQVAFDKKNFQSWADYYQDIIDNADQHTVEFVAHANEQLSSINAGDSAATVYSNTFYKSDFGELPEGATDAALVLTPILPNGEVISPDHLENYAQQIFKGEEIDLSKDGYTYSGDEGITLGVFGQDEYGAKYKEEADDFAQGLHQAQEIYYQMKDPLNLSMKLDQEGINGLLEVKELQGVIQKNGDDVSVIDRKTFEDILEGAGYTEDAIDSLASKMEEVNENIFNPDPLNIDSSMYSLEALKELDDVKKAFTEDADTGITIFDEDMFENILDEAGYAKDKIKELTNEVKNFENVVSVSDDTDPIGLKSGIKDINKIRSAFKALGVEAKKTEKVFGLFGKESLTINVPDLVQALVDKGWTPDNIKSYITGLSNEDLGFNINMENMDAGLAKVEELKGQDGTTVSSTLKVDDSQVDTARTNFNSLNGMRATAFLDIIASLGFSGKANGTANVDGTAYQNGSWGAPKTETALVGELGPEMLVRDGRWTTIGDNGAEFRQIKKGDIIFNHKQTEDLLSKGYVTGRGKAYASGTAYVTANSSFHKYTPGQGLTSVGSKNNKTDEMGNEIEDTFEEVFDWFEVLLEEINEQLDLMNAKLENAVGISAKNSLIEQILNTNKYKMAELLEGLELYEDYARKLLNDIPSEYRDMAQNGAVKITEFIGESQEDTVEAIEKYREWAEKVADLNQQLEETKTEISDLAKQAIDNIAEEYDNQVGLVESKIDQLDAYNALIETTIGTESAHVYEAIIKENNANIQKLQEQRNKMQVELNKQVAAGNIEKYSQNWYDAIQDISDLDAEIIDLTVDTKDYQDTINDLHWDHFDNLLARLEAISNETENLIDVLGGKDLVDKEGNWTDEGITSLGLYVQKLEMAEVQAKKYEEEISYLNKNWKKLGYTEQEYIEKLDDLKSGQYDAIKLYNDTKDAIVDLNAERVDAIKEGIEKEIEAYEELIEKEKEALDAEKDLYDFQKNINEQEANISKIRRQLAALSADDPTSRARRAKLEAELAEAQAELEEAYYERSIEDQQNALDKELENFQNTKDEEIEKLDEYLENTELVVSDSLALIQANTDTVYQTLTEMSKEYGLSIAEAITSPWSDGIVAVQNYSEQFGISMSSTVEELQKVADQYRKTIAEIENAGKESVEQVNTNSKTYTNNSETPVEKTTSTPKTVQVGSTINASGAKIYAASDGSGAGKQYYSSDPVYVVIGENNGYWKVRHRSLYNGVTGWFKKSDVKAYAKGTTGVDEDQLALLHELGDELIMHAGPNGKLSFLTKGSAVIPHDISENLMQLGQLDPQDVLERNRPIIGAPHVTNNNIELKLEVGEVVHIDTVTNETVPNLAKTIEKQMDKYVQKMNAEIRKYTR